MPATQNYRLPDWHESPFLNAVHSFDLVPDSRVFDINSPEDIAECLLESSDEIETYRWVLTDQQLKQLALDSARTIIEKRNERELQTRFEQAKMQRSINENGTSLAVVVSLVQNLETGETTFTNSHVPMSRIRA